MFSLRSMLSATLTTGALLATTATAAHADERQLFVWSGTVDREAIIVMRGSAIETRGDGFNPFRDAQYRVSDALPRAAGRVRVQRADGRGDVDVIEQPSPLNGYTTRVRVRDPQSGADRYRLVATWDGVGNDRYDDRSNDRYDDRSNDRYDDRNDGHNDGRNDDRDDGRYDGRSDDRYDDRSNGRYDDRGNRGRGRGNGKWKKDKGRYGDRDDRDGRDDRNDRNDRNDRDRDGFGTRRDAGVMRFSGMVDDVAEIRIRGRRVDVVSRSGRPPYNVRYDVRGAGLPNYALPLDLRRNAGRGNVTVVQQPRAWNSWTAVIRIDDSSGGPDNYDIDLRW